MEVVDKKKFERAKELPALPTEEGPKVAEITEEQFNQMLEDMNNPVQAQQRLAVQVKTFLDHRIKQEMSEKGFLSDHTRRWVEAYNVILEKIQKALYGDKSVSLNFNVHKITHSQIAAKIRKAEENEASN